MKTKTGYTVLEILIVLGLSIIVIGTVLYAYTFGANYMLYSDTKAYLQFNARLATRTAVKDLQRTNLNYVTITQQVVGSGDPADTIDYLLLGDQDSDGVPNQTAVGDPDWSSGRSVTISLDTNTNRLLRTESGNTKVIGRDVKSVRFMSHVTDPALPLNELRMIIEMEKTVRNRVHSYEMTTIINVRN